MKVFLWVSLVMSCIGVLGRAINISIKDYPRSVTYKRGEELIYMLISIGFVVWAGVLLFV